MPQFKRRIKYAVYEKEPAHQSEQNGVILGVYDSIEEAEEAGKKYGYHGDNYFVDVDKTKCQFCKDKFPTHEMFLGHMAMILPDPVWEDKIDEWGRENWWKNLERDDLSEEEKKELDDLCFYDQLLNTVGRGACCKGCAEKEMELYERYYPNENLNEEEN